MFSYRNKSPRTIFIKIHLVFKKYIVESIKSNSNSNSELSYRRSYKIDTFCLPLVLEIHNEKQGVLNDSYLIWVVTKSVEYVLIFSALYSRNFSHHYLFFLVSRSRFSPIYSQIALVNQSPPSPPLPKICIHLKKKMFNCNTTTLYSLAAI